MPYVAVLAGADLVFPGPSMTPAALLRLIERRRVTVTAGVPTIWMGAVPLLKEHDLSSLRLVVGDGSAVPSTLSESWREAIGLPITQAWGTETSPIGTATTLRSHHADLTQADSGAEQAWDGVSAGELHAAGPWIASGAELPPRTSWSTCAPVSPGGAARRPGVGSRPAWM